MVRLFKNNRTNNVFGSVEIISLISIMDIVNKTKSFIEGKITRLETYIEIINNETDSIELKVKLKSFGILKIIFKKYEKNTIAFQK